MKLLRAISGNHRTLVRAVGRRNFCAPSEEYVKRNYASNDAGYNTVIGSLTALRRNYMDGVKPKRDTVTRSTRLAAAATHSASFHSTSAFLDKWKNKFTSGVTKDQEPLKSNIRFTVRKKGPDPKKALQGILYNGGCSTSQHMIAAGYTDQLKKKSRIKPTHHSKRAAQRKLNRKPRRENSCDDCDDNPARDFFAAFGKAGSNSKFRRWEQRSEWTKNSDSTNSRFYVQDANSTTCADRKILGLPATGPLKIDDVKTAFRTSALKWHPDRHQRSSQAAAEEQFKHCVDAYKSLCASVSSR